jgi:hypothetical protein
MSSFDIPTLMKALREHPVPLEHMCQLRDVLVKQNSTPNLLFSACRDSEQDGSELADAELATILSGVVLGQWPMGVAAVDAWVERLLERRPSCVLEFGSGVSTVVSATILRRIHGDQQIRVFSIEQGEDAGAETHARLEANGLTGLVAMHIAPLQDAVVDVFSGSGYGTSPEKLANFIGDSRPEMVMVDGPFGKYGARFSTLPLVHSLLASDAEIWMDDALRDSELAIARWWNELGYISDPELQWTAKGILRAQRGSSPKRYAAAAHSMGSGGMSGLVAEYALFKLRVQAARANKTGLQPPFMTT